VTDPAQDYLDTIRLRWELGRSTAGAVVDAAGSGLDDLDWKPASVPGTVAGALRDLGEWDVDDRLDFDSFDWWFRSSFTAPTGRARLRIDGLATIADVWFNGVHVLHSDNMFAAHCIDVDLDSSNDLVIVCRSLKAHLGGRRPRPRWKTRIVDNQQLRWARTTLLGRMPSWTPPAPPVGIWRALSITTLSGVVLDRRSIVTSIDGSDRGVIACSAAVGGLNAPVSAWLAVAGATALRQQLDLISEDGSWTVSGVIVIDDVERWWPHTHGRPARYDVELQIDDDGTIVVLQLGSVGFRTISFDRSNNGFSVAVNGIDVFCRGACWVPLDVVTLQSSPDELADSLFQVRDAGMNMVRLTGPTVYETDEFYELCDELGILVWQDLMFANLDYPAEDEAFAASVDAEVSGVLQRLQRHPSVVVICGGSEIEQQASMMGVNSDAPINELGRNRLPQLVAESRISAEYVVCSPSGGAFSFVPNAGVSHYYGVGAYLRPLDDARRASVRFASECLAFSNIPCSETVDALLGDGERPNHAPRWKARVPRDKGAGWDFEDVRDHYVRVIFGVDPMDIRYSDPDRYLDLGRAAVCVAMESSMCEWRRRGSSCSGALVLQLRDLWRGPGWGVIDSDSRPKSAYYALRRAFAPVAVSLTDEGLNGVHAHVMNDRPEPFDGLLDASVYGHDGLIVTARTEVTLDAHGGNSLSVDSLFPEFRDLNFAYRFGPARYEVIAVSLTSASGATISESVHLPLGHGNVRRADPRMTASIIETDKGQVVRIATQGFAHFVSIDIPGADCRDNWFHLAPGGQRDVGIVRRRPARGVAELSALNGFGAVVISS